MKILNLKYCIGTLAASLLLAACASDELTDGTVQNLPEGMYPLQIAGVSVTGESTAEPWGANVPQTRIAESTNGNSSVWDGGEEITVQLSGTMADGTSYTAEGQYTLGDDKQTLTPVSGKELYWRSTSAGTVTAWCSPTASDNTVNLSNQSNGLAYVLKAEASNVTYNTSPSLSFSHQLAKVRVELTGEMASFVDNFSIKSYTTCTLTQGTLGNGANAEEIKMYRVGDKVFEANVYPGCQIKDVKANNGEWSTLSSTVTPEAAKIYTITIAVNGTNVTTIDLSKQEDVYTVESSDPVIIDGGGQELNRRIIIKENAKVMLKNVKLAAPTTNDNTIEINGSATLLLSGTNEIKASNNKCPLAVTSGTLIINGTDKDKLTLTGEDGYNAGCLGLSTGANLIINGGNIVADGSKTQLGSGIGSYWTGLYNPHCGSITINGGIIKALGGGNSAGIGSGSQCGGGDIIITGGQITVTGGKGNLGGAGIGSGEHGRCGNITISGENTVVTATASMQGCDKIGVGYRGSCGTVTIKAGATVNNTKYNEDHVGRI